MNNDQPKPQTLFAEAQADAALEAKGRFAVGQRPPRINGSEPTVPALAVPIWSQGPMPGTEPPLGFAIDELPDMEKVNP